MTLSQIFKDQPQQPRLRGVPVQPRPPEPDPDPAMSIRLRALEDRVRHLEAIEAVRAERGVELTPFENAVLEMEARVRLLTAEVAFLRSGGKP